MAAAAAGAGIFSGFVGAFENARETQSNARKEIAELTRQQQRDSEIAAEQKSDRAREADQALGTLLAASADTGQTTAGTARAGGEIAGVAGLDIARIESNRAERSSAIRSQQQSVSSNAQHSSIMGIIGAFGSAANTVAQFKSSAGEKESTPTSGRKVQRGRGPQFTNTGTDVRSQGSF